MIVKYLIKKHTTSIQKFTSVKKTKQKQKTNIEKMTIYLFKYTTHLKIFFFFFRIEKVYVVHDGFFNEL